MMESIRKWLYKPKRDDKSLLAQFFYADEDLNTVANELDSFDGRKDPERCTSLVNRLRQAQDKVLTITNGIMDALIGDERANRDFRVKFPEDVLQENLAGQLWFGAECLAAGSSIMNRETESTAMRPLAKAVTKSLENVRNLLRDACLRNNIPNGPIQLDTNELFTEMLLESLKIFDRLFAEFELAYVSAMVPIKSTLEYELQELIGVLFSETLQRALKMNLLTHEMVDDCDPALMFAIPRLAIVSGLLVFPDGPLRIDQPVDKMSEMFRPFRTLLLKIRDLLWILNKRELYLLEKLLCDNEQITDVKSFFDLNLDGNRDEFFDQFYSDYSPFDKEKLGKSDQEVRDADPTVDLSKNNNIPTLNNYNEPSTSGSLIPANVVCNAVIAEYGSPPDLDSQEIISIAAATLSSILNTSETGVSKKLDGEANDSGISTEVTSLDRSPSLDLGDARNTQKSTNYIKNRLHHSVHHVDRHKQTSGDELSYSSSSSDTSSFNSIDADDVEIALAVKAAELANSTELRAKYRSCEDLIHRLFVCIAGVADQLQTNFACDLRNILRSVFLINSCDSVESPKSLETSSLSLDTSIEYRPTEDEVIENNEFSVDPNILAQEALFDTNVYFHLETEGCLNTEYTNHPRQYDAGDQASLSSLSSELNRYASLRDDVNQLNPPVSPAPPYENEIHDVQEKPPMWIPDVQAPKCMGCYCAFTVVKRRHHCRNCGKVFCGKCSSNSVPLPKFGIDKPVRVCNKCFIYNLTPFL